MTLDFSSKGMQGLRQWSNIFKVMKEKMVNLASIDNKIYISQKDSKIKAFSNIPKQKDYISIRLTLQKMLKETLRKKESNTRWK